MYGTSDSLTVCRFRRGRPSKPQIIKPARKMPLDLNIPASAKRTEAKNHCCLVQHSIPNGESMVIGRQSELDSLTYPNRRNS